VPIYLGGKPAGIRPYTGPNIRYDYNIKMDFTEMWCERDK
jgi:hypothetical protein